MKKAIVIIIILALVGLAVWRVGLVLKERASANETTEEPLVAVEVEPVKLGTIEDSLTFVGNIIADAEVTVFPKTMGRVENMRVDEGSNVSKGAVLAKLEDKELRLRVKQTEVALDTAKTGYTQAKALSEIKIRSQVAQAEAGLLGAEAALKQVQDSQNKGLKPIGASSSRPRCPQNQPEKNKGWCKTRRTQADRGNSRTGKS